MKSLGLALLNVIIVSLSIVIHRVLIRVYSLPTNDSFIFWGALIGIIFLITLLASLILRIERKH